MTEIAVTLPLSRQLQRVDAAVLDAVNKGTRILHAAVRESIAGHTRMVLLAESYQTTPAEEIISGRIRGTVFSDHKQAKLREYGHDKILPGKNLVKSGPRKGQPTRALAVPIDDSLTGEGISKGGPSLFKDLEYIPTKHSPHAFAVLAKVRKVHGQDDVIESVRFALLHSVTVRGRHDVRDAVARTKGRIREILNQAIADATKGSA